MMAIKKERTMVIKMYWVMKNDRLMFLMEKEQLMVMKMILLMVMKMEQQDMCRK